MNSNPNQQPITQVQGQPIPQQGTQPVPGYGYPGQMPYPYYHPGQPYPQMMQNPYNQGFPMNEKDLDMRKKHEINKVIPQKKGSAWSGLEFRPENVKFANQNRDEHVYIIVRRHWTANISWMVKNFLYSLIPFVVYFALSLIEVEISENIFSFRNIFIFLTFYYAIILTNIIRDFFDWFFDPYIVTDQRIIHYEFTPFSAYTIKEADLKNIEYVKEQIAGPLGQLFNYGDIYITTASEAGQFEFDRVPNPTVVRDTIADLQRIAKRYDFN